MAGLLASGCTHTVALDRNPSDTQIARTYVGIVHVIRTKGETPAVELVGALGLQTGGGRVTLGYVSEHVVRLDERCRVVFILDSLSDANRVALAEQHRDVCVVEPPFVPPQEVSR